MTPRAPTPHTTPSPPTSTTLRCAIYTRKSSEEGLDMAFNSLDAQREAGLDYIKSQRSHGWVAIDALYDDGGFSGGNTERPGLKRLLADIRAQRVDIVVVYKVDRLSRSLTDFARLMQLFDDHRVSFVSVTQQFNTTTSMGRLTLNMLLSFAQFEREVAGERIRDKIAATFRRGVFVTGQPPLGYRRPREGEPGFVERKLLIVPEEAELVRSVYTGYLELRSLVALAARLNAAGHRTKLWTSSRGVPRGGKPFSASLVHRILTNPIYIGKIAHTRRVSQPHLALADPNR
jgi:site-specific DNA recombinase